MKTDIKISSIKWTKNTAPKRILAIRLQATGDTIITLPYLQSLKNSLPPTTQLDFLTRKECASIPSNLTLFNNVYIINGDRNFKKQFLYAIMLLPKLLLNRYNVVIDLQNNSISKFVRKSIMPSAWSEFDRFSPISAGERTRLTINALGFCKVSIESNFTFKTLILIDKLLSDNGWDKISNLVILNPAGAFATRNWQLENYLAYANLWLKQYPNTQMLILGLPLIKEKAAELQRNLSNRLINLVGKTTSMEAFAIIQKAQFVLSEDSGLMHMAWISGMPTLAIFGSTRSDWSTPLGNHTLLLSSDDLVCGNCMLETCKYGDVHCITRYSPEFVFEKSMAILQSL